VPPVLGLFLILSGGDGVMLGTRSLLAVELTN
jgi:hypothetical protein